MIQGVIFDLDGVLTNTDRLHYKAWKMLAEEIGIKGYGTEDNDRQRGLSRMASLEVLLKKSEKIFPLKEKEILADRKNKYYLDLFLQSDEDVLLPGAEEALDYLKGIKMKIAVASSSRNAPWVINKSGIGKYIDACVCGSDIRHTKPDPEIFLKAAEMINVLGKNCLAVEDSEAGIEAAKRAGMRTLGVGCRFVRLNAEYVAEDLSSVKDWKRMLK